VHGYICLYLRLLSICCVILEGRLQHRLPTCPSRWLPCAVVLRSLLHRACSYPPQPDHRSSHAILLQRAHG